MRPPPANPGDGALATAGWRGRVSPLMRITRLEVRDIRFPTSKGLDGSDAMNPDPDYSSAYVILHTDTEWKGYGSTFTIGRGNDVV